jgi:hypothetical protein
MRYLRKDNAAVERSVRKKFMKMKYTVEKKLIAFIVITLVAFHGYQLYCNYQSDKYIYEAMEAHNKSVRRYIEINNDLTAENTGLKHNLLYEQSMREASKGHVDTLEEQIDIVARYWAQEHLKVSEELFDLKNTHSERNKPKIIEIEDTPDLSE